MNFEELMVGDWIHPKGYNGKYFRVEREDFVNYIDNDIEPIKITSEILEKNGFKMDISNGWNICNIGKKDTDSEFDRISCEDLSRFDSDEWRLSIDMYTIAHGSLFIKYVHELQHALRMCKIDKEIKL